MDVHSTSERPAPPAQSTDTPPAQLNQHQLQVPGLSKDEQRKAAQLIQRTYRGYRTRRELQGYGLDPTTRWLETIRDAKYREITAPQSPGPKPAARQKWHQVAAIARHAGADDSTDHASDVILSDSSDSNADASRHRTQQEQREREQRKAVAREMRKRTAKMMDLQYFLEMVDHKHRYGSNLRKYHAHWKSQPTDQNFFYWLDHGDGKHVELEECSRARLENEQVRYLSREERMNYMVRVDNEGKLRWAKNGNYVWTKDELYRDSVKGIVPTTDNTPIWTHNVKSEDNDDSNSDSDSDLEVVEDPNPDPDPDQLKQQEKSGLEGERYVNESFHRASGPAKLKHVSAAVFFNHMIRQSLKKGHKWIFVADTSFRLYIGYKQSGAFQHSSFLQGARILSAGLIKVKDGQLRRLSPLSGHYRPPAANFRSFVHTLEDAGCDMSHVSISRSYAILVGLETYVRTRRKIKQSQKSVLHQIDKVVHPEKIKAEEEAAQDHSQSARKEREYLEKQRLDELDRRNKEKTFGQSVSKHMSHAWDRITRKTVSLDGQGVAAERGTPGTGPEDGVPAPDGHRHLERTM